MERGEREDSETEGYKERERDKEIKRREKIRERKE